MADSKVFYTDILLRKDYLALNLFQRDLFWRMWCHSDYHGRYHADPEIIRGHFYAKEINKTREADIERALEAIARTSLVHFYTVDSSAYFEIPAEIHRQRIRTKSKFPNPPQSAATCRNLPQSAAQCDNPAATCSNLPQSAAICRNLPQSAAQIEIEEEIEIEKEERGDIKQRSISKPPENTPSLFNSENERQEYRTWLRAIKTTHPSAREIRQLPLKLHQTAIAAFRAVPHAAAEAPLLRAFYDSTITISCKTGRPFKRPAEFQWYLVDLADVLTAARQWAKETKWKPAGTPRPAKAAPAAPAQPQEPVSEQEKIDFLAEIRAACSTIATPPPSVPPQDYNP